MYLLIGTDNYLAFSVIKIFSLKKNYCFFNFKNIFYYNNFFFLNIYNFIKIKKNILDFLFILNYGYLISPFFLKLFYYGLINFHFSLLPILKGCNPLNNYLSLKNFIIGFSIIYLNKFLDSGYIIFKLKSYFFLNIYIYIFFFLKFNYIFYYINIFYKLKVKKIIFYSQLNIFNYLNSKKIK